LRGNPIIRREVIKETVKEERGDEVEHWEKNGQQTSGA
jgi:hypothetical protein